MDGSSWVDTSLNLNTNPLVKLCEDDAAAKQEQFNFLELGTNNNITLEEEISSLKEDLNRVREENKKLTEMLSVMCDNYNALKNKVMEYTSKFQSETQEIGTKKRKSESSNSENNNCNIVAMNGNSEISSTEEESCKKPRQEVIKSNISRVYVRSDASDTSPVVKDGYQWKKYGQKVTRDNPSPRAYFKCSYAPICPVKKKVQRSVEDQYVIVATYEGEHNHPHPAKTEATSGSSRAGTLSSLPFSATSGLSGQQTRPDLAKSKAISNVHFNGDSKRKSETREDHQFLVEHIASSLTKDPNFTAVLAKMLHQNRS